jgi:hypothetical protein
LQGAIDAFDLTGTPPHDMSRLAEALFTAPLTETEIDDANL